MRSAPPVDRPISGRRDNLRFPKTLLGESGSRDFEFSPGGHMGGGLSDSGGARSDVSVACFIGGLRRTQGPEIDQLRRPARARV